MKFMLTVLGILLLQLPNLALAAENTAEEQAPIIEVNQRFTDEKIQKRIEAIFTEFDSLSNIQVSVDKGVVTLTGEVANDSDGQKAQRLATRIESVVEVKDQIERTLDIEDNVQPVIEQIKSLAHKFLKALPLILISLLVFFLILWAGRLIANQKLLWSKLSPNPFISDLISSLIKLVFFLVALIITLNILGAKAFIGTILGSAGLVGVAIGFAVKDTLENYISSIMLSIRQPFRAKDHVVINDKEGIVVRLTSRATILMTRDGNHLRIPNSEVFKATILNYTTNHERRFQFELGVDADDDPILAMKMGLDALAKHDFVLKKPEARAVIKQVGDSNIIIDFQVWIDQRNTDYGRARSLAIRTAKNVLEENGFTLPEPIYRLRFDKLPSALLAEEGAPKEPRSVKPTPEKKTVTDQEAEDLLDVKPDDHLLKKVEQEQQESPDLLTDNAQKE